MYIETPLMPRFSDTDAMGHINNTAVAQWFEMGRMDMLRNAFTRSPTFLVRRLELDYEKEMYYEGDVVVRSGVESVGSKSVIFHQEIWQEGVLTAQCKDIEVYYDMKARQTAQVPDWLREELKGLMFFE